MEGKWSGKVSTAKTTKGRRIYSLPVDKDGKVRTDLVAKPDRYKPYYGQTDPAYQTALKAAKKNDPPIRVGVPKRVTANIFSDKAENQSKINMDVLEKIALEL